jgi:pimeloyl-ACP methyl ester carboxylesterase
VRALRAVRVKKMVVATRRRKQGATRRAAVGRLAMRSVRIREEKVRVWEKGRGRPLGVLSGLFGFPAWTLFLEALSAKRRVVVPSLPGHPGGADFRKLDDLADWVVATQELLEAAGLAGADLVGLGPGGTLAAEVAAFSPVLVKRLALVAPFGLFDEREPVADLWAKRTVELPATFSAKPAEFAAQVLAPPAGADSIEFQVQQVRALESAARLLWPFGDRGLAKRLHRISAPTLLVWGGDDRIVPASYAKRFAAGIRGRTRIRSLAGAGHRADLDAPEALAKAVLGFLA